MGNRKLEQTELDFLERHLRALRIFLLKQRLEVGLTQEEVSLRGQMDRKAIGRIEAGHIDPRYSTLVLAAQGLGLSPATFFRALADHMEGKGDIERVLSEEKYYAPDGSHWVEIRRGSGETSGPTKGTKNPPRTGTTKG